MTPEQFRDKLFVSHARKGGLIDVRVGITLKAIVTVDDEKKIPEAEEIAKNDLINGVYGGRREEFRKLLNDLLDVSMPRFTIEYDEAVDKLIAFQESL